MTLQRFVQLDYPGQMEATMEATCIGGRDENKFKVLLYQLNNFYIEVYYHKKHSHISDFVAFDSVEMLEPYLEQIKLEW